MYTEYKIHGEIDEIGKLLALYNLFVEWGMPENKAKTLAVKAVFPHLGYPGDPCCRVVFEDAG